MRYFVKWSPEAERTYNIILDYLIEKWTERELQNFIKRTNQVVNFIAHNPREYIFSKKKNAYRAVITKHVSLYYRVEQQTLELLLFWDNRKDPESLKF
jgi:plasmid stabilization system protein ParE